eukprot:TRINITY_DN2273_c0_g2_i1.p1 TRINITY_DN2273_c0_g2~~TRINITY_DN2273_c0_g2_i1.p1  ORF type:complete len:504 (+),score=64.98 TRINITY_DN2273_c0_g2_i1:1805-3316(+)
MVVLASSIVTKGGKVLVSRQFVEMTRVRIEGLLAAFPKLVGSGKQHTYVETENVRYVYQPLEGMYLLLITNKQSNILEDLETLRLLSKVVPEFIPVVEEESISKGAFDLIFAFDEVISLGHKENITVQQVRQNTEMDSHEEKLHKMIIDSKRAEAKVIMKERAADIERKKIEQKKMGVDPYASKSVSQYGMESSSVGGMGMSDSTPSFNRPAPTPAAPSRSSAKGMQLGKAKKTSDFLAALQADGEVVEDTPVAASGAPRPAPIVSEPVFIDIEEKMHVLLNKDGGLESMEVQGTMSLEVKSEEAGCIRVLVQQGENKGYQFKTHPNIDKPLYSSQSMLGLKDPSRPFPTGSPLGVLKWRFQTKDENLLPLSINCWPSQSGGESYVNIEYESGADYDIHNVVIGIPCMMSPTVNQIDGDWRFDSRQHMVLWTIELIDDTNRSGSMEFVVPSSSPDSFFPVVVTFSCNKTLCDVGALSVIQASDSSSVKFANRTQLICESYEVV